ncbi:uncharacterized protein LOC126616215 isoform X1 [Malus sylvestris]|uniref:uncharacterized protein LOC126616215 isoform X1 n=1 Tax=Malus sylvestris TaxID=3752 RepID=UPI0021AD2095|nr:uncharacterized protein LOC126616215 isoform X1 [Malus sylvestris]
MARLSNLYLLAYNSLQAAAWAVCLSLSLSSAVNGAYASAGHLIYLLQMVQFLEVIHGAIGLVPSGVVFPLMQWAGRAHFLYVVRQTHEVQESPSVFITFVAWSLSEVIRYPHYAFNCTGSCPSWITYLRYTAFIVLYPPGMAGETWLMYQALPFIKKKSLSPDFPAGLSFSYYNFLRVPGYGCLDQIEPVPRTGCQLAGHYMLNDTISVTFFHNTLSSYCSPPLFFLLYQVPGFFQYLMSSCCRH